MKNLIDMHIHTNYSDGEFSPNEVINMGIKQGISVMAITDHDTINGIKSISKDSLKNKKIKIINGIEINCKCNKGTMHILGYDFDINNYKLNNWLEELRTNRMNSTLSVMEQIKRDYKIIFNYQDIINLINKNSIGRPDLAKLCIKYGFCNSVSEAFDMYLNPAHDKVKGTNKRIEYKESFKLIKNSGGLVILAHPNSLLLNDIELDNLILKMKDNGLDGIEVYHSSFNKQQSDYYSLLAQKYDLLISGGSDYHGPLVKPGIEIGHGKNNNINIKKLSLVEEIERRTNNEKKFRWPFICYIRAKHGKSKDNSQIY